MSAVHWVGTVLVIVGVGIALLGLGMTVAGIPAYRRSAIWPAAGLILGIASITCAVAYALLTWFPSSS